MLVFVSEHVTLCTCTCDWHSLLCSTCSIPTPPTCDMKSLLQFVCNLNQHSEKRNLFSYLTSKHNSLTGSDVKWLKRLCFWLCWFKLHANCSIIIIIIISALQIINLIIQCIIQPPVIQTIVIASIMLGN